MKNILKFSILSTISFLLFSNSILAQEWSNEQKDVWAGVLKYWEIDNNNPTSFLKYFDDSYLGWSNDNEAPQTKEDTEKLFKYYSSKRKMQFNTLTPARIWVEGNFAFVHYYYTEVSENKDGTPHEEKGRWTDILRKKNGTWMIVGDHGGENSSD